MQCKICEKNSKNLSNHILYKHVKNNQVESLEEYYEKYVGENIIKSCIICGNPTKFKNVNQGWARTCSHTCSMRNPQVIERRKENCEKTLLAKYGVKNPGQISGHREKCKQTNLRIHGDENWNNPDKAKQTNLDRYGVISYTKTDEYKEKYKTTCLEKYGTEHHTSSESYRENKKKATLEKYGTEHILQVPEIREKIKNTTVEKYGGFTFASPELVSKVRKTCNERYGVEHPIQNDIIKDKVRKTKIEKYGTMDAFTLYAKSLGYANINDIPEIKELQKRTRLKTLLEKYNVTNIANVPEIREYIKEKVKATNLEKYGVECILQSPIVINRSKFNVKQYLDTTITYQSKLEYKFITECLKNNIQVDNGDIIKYTTVSGDTRNYYVDFKLTYQDGTQQLVEIKAKHVWYYKDLESGTLDLKAKAAQEHSLQCGYKPYVIVFNVKEFFKNGI